MKYSARFFPAQARVLLMVAAVMLAGAFAGSVGAQPDPLSDPPGRVARLSDSSGQVWLYSPDAGEWVNAVRNRPLTTGDRLATDPGARAEVQVGSTTVRLDGGTELELRNLDDDHVSLQLLNGSVSARFRDAAEAGEFDLTTEDGQFLVRSIGRYRFDRDTSASFVTVYAGQARYEGPNSGLTIQAGQRAEFWIDAANAAQYRLSEPRVDAFAAWNGERDRNSDRSASARYVSPAMTGAEDLDRYGRWEEDPDYGALWIPRGVAVDWAPYSTGRWAWVLPWGWTWVDDAPWGFAPFHYGRWVQRRNTWCWAPGQRVMRPVYAPALVGWVGGPGVGVSISIGGGRAPAPVVGWFPLAPREVYVPSYRASPRYAQNINITHVTNVTQITNVINNPQAPREFGNRGVLHAVTVVPTAVMTGRQPVAPAASQLRDAPWVRDIAKQPAGGTVLVNAPVTAPAAPPRGPQGRVVTSVPAGAPTPASAPAGARSPIPQRDRPPVAAAPARRPTPESGDGRRGGARGDGAVPTETPIAAPVPRPGSPSPPVPARPVAPRETGVGAAVSPAVQEAPRMRPLPVQRGEERRPPPRPEAPAAVEPRATVPAVAPPRPAETARPPLPPIPPAAPAVARPAEPAKAPPAEVKKVEAPPRPHVELPKDPRDDKRAEPRERDTR